MSDELFDALVGDARRAWVDLCRSRATALTALRKATRATAALRETIEAFPVPAVRS